MKKKRRNQHPLYTTTNHGRVEIGVGVPTPKSLIFDIELEDGFKSKRII